MVRAGEDITVIDNASKDDLTSLTLAQIIYEQEKKSSEVLPLSALRELVRRSEARLADLRDGLLPRADPSPTEEAGAKDDADPRRGLLESSREALEDFQRRVDERLHALLDTLAPFRQLQEEIGRVAQRLEEVEGRLRKLSLRRRSDDEDGAVGSPQARE
jgi:chromosome segregation ATPase